ncbi:hypothetical protein GCM10010124_26040 [Pilimelia terevasa]|uniref:Terminase n=1 Tax=Pilimelia terevasa TaxID=53372 RepID=A0A8J3BNK1_9ACTN|nr:terminase large subunit [Pilimelia terevasa]GGK32069.1 hypothetical protein GCM10010124_26040 [Pilimelia terevasa]
MTVIDLAAADRPRVLHLPSYSTSAGDEAIDLAASAGLHLDPWQKYVLRHSLGERADGRWAAFEVGLIVARQQGKGAVLEARELAGLILFGEELIMHTAHELKTSMRHFKRLMGLFEKSADLSRRLKRVSRSNGKEGLEMVSGAELQCLARSKGSGRGYSGDLVVLDEAYDLVEDEMDATMPTMLARDNAQVWYCSSPPLNPVSGQILMSVRDRAEAGAATRLAWFDYGLAGRLDRIDQIDLDDRANWWAALPAMRSGRVREENVQALRDQLSDIGFAREIMGIWPPGLAGAFRVISEADWESARDPQSRIVGAPVFAPAVSLDRRWSAIGSCGFRADGLRHVEVVETGPGTGWVAPRLAELKRAHRSGAVVVDEFGPTGSLIPEVEKAGVKVERIGAGDAARAYGMFYDAFAGLPYVDKDSGLEVDPRNARHIGQEELTEAVKVAVDRKLGEGKAWDRRSPEDDITPLVSVTNAYWGLSKFGSRKRKPMAAYV